METSTVMAVQVPQPPPQRDAPGPHIDPASGSVQFVVNDAGDQRTPLSVWFHLADYGADTRFRREGTSWVARIPRPPVNRLEYLLEFGYPDGTRAMLTDPANPRRVRGVFGDHSLLEWPEYRPPWWLAVARATAAQDRHDELAAAARRAARLAHGPARNRELGEVPTQTRRTEEPDSSGSSPPDLTVATTLRISTRGTASNPPTLLEGVASIELARAGVSPEDGRRGRAAGPSAPWQFAPASSDSVVDERAAVVVTGTLHLPAGTRPADPLPLLVVHDGPEYEHLGRLMDYLWVLGRIEPGFRARVLSLAPVDRDRCYSASPAYARALVREMLPHIRSTVRITGPVVGVGASLGALSLLHAAITYPGTFGGLLCQSGSFFLPRTDSQEQGYRFYNRIVRFVESADADPDRLTGLRVAMTCGRGEENLANNRSLMRRLTKAGVPVSFVENPDGHNYTGWRDCLDPSLRDLLGQLWLATGNR